ncbi:hypothetical protein STFR1_80026 [Bacillus vallismortis]
MERDSSARDRFRHSVFHPAVYLIAYTENPNGSVWVFYVNNKETAAAKKQQATNA